MTDTPDLVLYGSPLSPFVRKAAAVCIEKDVPFEIEAVNVFDPPEWFREISPMKRIPVLRDRSVATEGITGTIADSSAICAYIERKHGLTSEQAYILASVAVDLRVGQVVDVPNYVVTAVLNMDVFAP